MELCVINDFKEDNCRLWYLFAFFSNCGKLKAFDGSKLIKKKAMEQEVEQKTIVEFGQIPKIKTLELMMALLPCRLPLPEAEIFKSHRFIVKKNV